MLDILCADTIAPIISFLSGLSFDPLDGRAGEFVVFDHELEEAIVLIRPLITLLLVRSSLHGIITLDPTFREHIICARRAHIRVRHSHDAAIMMQSHLPIRGAYATYLLNQILSSVSGLPVRLCAGSSPTRSHEKEMHGQFSDLRPGCGYIAELKATEDTDFEHGVCSMVEANWLSVTIRCPLTGRVIAVPPRFECGTLRIENQYSTEKGKITVLLESFDQEELIFSMLLLGSEREADAWGFDWDEWKNLPSCFDVAIGPALRRSDSNFNQLISKERMTASFSFAPSTSP